MSSTAYATDEILVVIVLQAGVGVAAFRSLIPIAIVVCVLMAIVVTSYRQTIHAYPSGGGAYIVSRENLGTLPALVAGSSLLVDYILTVAVSVAGGVLAIRTATGFGSEWTVPVCLLCVLFMTVINLRGVKESGAAFAGPTYFYILMLIILIFTGLYRIFVQHVGPIPPSILSAEAIEKSQATGIVRSVYVAARIFLRGRRAFRSRGRVQRCSCVSETRKQQRRNDAAVDGRNPRHHVLWGLGSRRPPQAVSRISRRQRPGIDGGIPVQRQGRDVLAHHDRHVLDPDTCG